MRVTLFSVVFLLCVLFVAHGAPLDSRSPKLKAVKSASSKAIPKKAPVIKAPKVKASKPVKPKAKPATKAKPAKTKVATKAKPVSKPKTTTKTTAAAKPKTKATKPKASVPVVAKAPATKVKSAVSAKKTKVAPKTKATSATVKSTAKATKVAKGSAAVKPTSTALAKACALKKTKTTGKAKKARTEECEDFCPTLSADGCSTCAASGCGFDFNTQTCQQIPSVGASTSTLVTDSTKCKEAETLAKKIAASAPPPPESEFKAAATNFFNDVSDHVFTGPAAAKKSGRHLLSAWVKDNGNDVVDESNKDTTGIIAFKFSPGSKTVWNDDPSRGKKVYTEDDVRAMCIDAFTFSLEAVPGNKAKLTADPKAKGKSKAPKLTLFNKPRDDAGFVVANPVTGAGQNLCVHADSATCFPLSLKATAQAPGTKCSGKDKVAE